MTDLNADIDALGQATGRLAPTAVVAARDAATGIRDSTVDCGDPLPGCRRFTAAVVQVADQVAAFCAQTEQEIQAYATKARDSAAGYVDADGTVKQLFGR
jgi:hypothetical protein